MKSKTFWMCALAAVMVCLFVLVLFVQPAAAHPASVPTLISASPQAAPPLAVVFGPELIAMITGVILSLAFSYVPGLAPAYEKLDGTWKRLIMLLLMAGVTAAVMGLGCAGILGGVDCTQNGITNAVLTFFLAAMANQTAYQLSPKAKTKTPDFVVDRMRS